MVEAVVSMAIEKLADLLIQEAGLLGGVKGDVERLQAELKRMQCFLEDADLKHEQDARVTNWINEIRALAYDTEDVIDEFVLRSLAYDRKIGIRGLISRLSRQLTKRVFLRKVAKQIKSIRVRIRDISAAMQTYGIKFTGEEECQSSNRKRMLQQLRRTYAHDDEDHVIISMEGSARNVVNELMKEYPKFQVVSIVGMGGLGKTTLARKIYNLVDIKRHFDCSSWSFISQQFSIKDVLQGIFKEITHKEQGGMHEEELVVTLYNALKEKRYLIVLDDIWKTDVWDLLKRAFPNGRKGSKVLLTTRDKKVALHADPWCSPIELPLLTNDEGWQLLQATAFPRGYIDDHAWDLTELENVGKEIVQKSGGLPLAIVVLGSLLATKAAIDEWKAVKRNITIQLNKQQQQRYDGVYGILALSYQELPFHLKPCFLYLSQFPESFEINKRRLIWMWIAEGFISRQHNLGDDETIEDVGEQYLEELINRCMVQVSQRDHTGRGVKTLRIHDLILDVCVLKASEDNFVKIIEHHRDDDTINSSAPAVHSSTVAKPRRIAIHSRMQLRKGSEYAQTFNSYIPLSEGDSHLRSLLYFVEGLGSYIVAPNKTTLVFKKFYLLRVLNFGEVCLTQKIPIEIGTLLHLRYLGLGDVRLHDNCCWLPKSIANLKNLLTLELQSGFQIERNALCKLKSLRYLIAEVDCRVDTLKQLETLIGIKAKNLLKNEAVFKLTKLRRLGATFETNEEVEVVMRSPIFSSGGLLRYLQMWMRNEQCSFPDLKQLSQCHHLTKLHLNGAISQNHTLEFLPPSISKLILEGSRLKQDPMAILEKLSNLRYLSLGRDAYEGSKMVCSAYGFPRLEELTLHGSKQLEEWIVEKNAMPCLKTLEIAIAGNMRNVPDGLKFVASLQQLVLVDLRKEVTDEIRVEAEKVRHVPTIIIL